MLIYNILWCYFTQKWNYWPGNYEKKILVWSYFFRNEPNSEYFV